METTIAAISTGLTPSGIIIVRMSGPEAVAIADKIYRGKKNKRLTQVKSRTVHYGFINDGNRDVDEVLITIMRAPNTYTGEDVAEINCHGGILVAKEVLELVQKKGAVLAEPGEFTRRAFLNGKMDMSRAEAVIDIIDAKNQYALKAGVSQLKGSVEKKVNELRDSLLDEMSYIEAALDDPEHYDLDGYEEQLDDHLDPICREIDTLSRRSEYGSILKEGIRTVIAGRPNAGKSSLLNLLSGYDKAIVTEIAGTTRDILEETIRLGPVSLILEDTAGIRNTEDIVEKIGVGKTMEALQNADLIIYLTDAREGITDEDREVLNRIAELPVILLYNKSDLTPDLHIPDAFPEYPRLKKMPFSALTGDGLEALEDLILKLFENSEILYNDEVVITNERQKACLREAKEALDLVRQGIADQMSEEFLAVDLMNAYAALGRIIGKEVGDDVVDRVFEKFCMGK